MGFDITFISTDFSPFRSLADFMESKKKRENRPQQEFFFAIALGLLKGFFAVTNRSEGGGQLYFHGDIKPQSAIIMRDGDGFIPKITDFGIAVSALDEVGGFSPAYAAPELVTGTENRLSFASEFYSLEITFYELFFARPPIVFLNGPLSSDEIATYRETVSHATIDFMNPFFDIKDDIKEKFILLIKKIMNYSEKERKKIKLFEIKEKIEEPIRLNDFYQRRENEISHLSRGKLYWNQEVHKIFRENEYFILVKTQTFSEKWIS